MPISMGVPGFSLTYEQRVEALIGMVGGPVKAAALTKKSRGAIDNWRKGADAPLQSLLILCKEARVSLDWVATGYQIRPDLAPGNGLADPMGSFEGGEGFVRLPPLQPELLQQGVASVERWTPSEIAFSVDWLHNKFGLTADTARYAIASDNGMAPLVEKGTLLVVDARSSNPRAGVYTVKVGDDLVARRLHRMPDGRSELVANADPAWRFSLSADAAANEALLLHRIVWAGQDL